MSCEGCVDEGLPVDFGTVCEGDGVLPAPAEACGADWECGALFFAELREEAFDAGPGFAGVVVDDEGDEADD